jgi:hypothetical protein
MAAFSGFYESPGLDLLHQVMLAVLHRSTAMAIKMARARGAFVLRRRLFRLL